MPLQRTSSQNSRNITEFFRPFAKSKARLVLDEVVHENIIVAGMFYLNQIITTDGP